MDFSARKAHDGDVIGGKPAVAPSVAVKVFFARVKVTAIAFDGKLAPRFCPPILDQQVSTIRPAGCLAAHHKARNPVGVHPAPQSLHQFKFDRAFCAFVAIARASDEVEAPPPLTVH
jgi:hypothetical protein